MTTPRPPLLSVIIPAYIPNNDHGASAMASLLRCVRGIIANGDAFLRSGALELLVQEDRSPGLDDAAWTEVLPGIAQLERNADNRGFAGNCNAGAARATGRYLLFTNQDAVPLRDCLAPLIDTFRIAAEAGQRAAVVGPKLLFPPERGMIEQEGQMPLLRLQSCGGWYDAHCQPTHRYLGWAEDAPEANVCEEVSWITGAIHCWDAELFREIGGYDEQYRKGYFEDVDACCRAQAAGHAHKEKWGVWYQPRSRWLHGGGSVGGVDAESFQHNAHLFWDRWVKTGRVSKDTDAVHEQWW